MAIDARIPLGIEQFSLADVLKNAEGLRASALDRTYKAHTMHRQAAEDSRNASYRSALADFITSRPGAGAPQAPAAAPLSAPPPDSRLGSLASMLAPLAAAESPPSPMAGPGPSSRDAAFARMAAADPVAAQAARKAEFEAADQQLDAISRLAGSAVDQQTYEVALQRATAMGLDVSHLPRTFNPNLVTQVLNEALSAKERLAAMRLDRRLDWDIEDDELDNERADENQDSLSSYREGSLANTRRGQDLTDRRGRRGQDMTDRRGRRGQDATDRRARDAPAGTDRVIAALVAKEARGEALSPSEQRVVNRHYSRRGGRGRAGGGAANPPANAAPVKIRPNEAVARLSDGRLAVSRNGEWVPATR